jgi:hypothetical protein
MLIKKRERMDGSTQNENSFSAFLFIPTEKNIQFSGGVAMSIFERFIAWLNGFFHDQ